MTSSTQVATVGETPAFPDAEDQKIARITYDVIRKLETQPDKLPSLSYLQQPEVQAAVLREVSSQYRPAQMELKGIAKQPDLAAIVAKTAELVVQQTIDIPRILVVPKGEMRSGYHPFSLDLATMNYQAPSEELWIQYLRTNEREVLGLGKGGIEEKRLEDYIVGSLIDFDDVAYDNHADLLYDLAGQVTAHLCSYLLEEDARKVLRLHQKEIGRFVHAQMQHHYWEEAADYEVKISRGFTELRESAYTAADGELPLDYRISPADKSNMARYRFAGFKRCLYRVQKFHSDAERKLAVILEREALKWFKPAKGQFQLFYKSGAEQLEYQPDFVAETSDLIYMLEPKARSQLDDADVLAKKAAAVQWCQHASDHAASYQGKPWHYALIPHDVISENMTIRALAGHTIGA